MLASDNGRTLVAALTAKFKRRQGLSSRTQKNRLHYLRFCRLECSIYTRLNGDVWVSHDDLAERQPGRAILDGGRRAG